MAVTAGEKQGTAAPAGTFQEEPAGMSNQMNQDEGGDQKARALKVSYM